MNQTDRKRFLFINFVMGQINGHTDEIYEALSDNNVDDVTEAIAQLMSVCEDLQESISDGVSTKANA
jgi:phage terminase Nu1 subunit (DNA packaging protein)